MFSSFTSISLASRYCKLSCEPGVRSTIKALNTVKLGHHVFFSSTVTFFFFWLSLLKQGLVRNVEGKFQKKSLDNFYFWRITLTPYRRKLRGLVYLLLTLSSVTYFSYSLTSLSFTSANPLQVSLVCECYYKESLLVVRSPNLRPIRRGNDSDGWPSRNTLCYTFSFFLPFPFYDWIFF